METLIQLSVCLVGGLMMSRLAKLLNLPAATVGTRLARGRERLKKLLEEELI